MAEQQEDRSTDDLTDEVSQSRSEEFRKRGIVVQSRELTSLIVVLAVLVTTYAMSAQMMAQISGFMREIFSQDFSSKFDLSQNHRLHQIWYKALTVTAWIGLPVCIAGFIFGALGSFLQVGSLFSPEAIQPDLNRLDPLQGAKRLLSKKHIYESIRLIFKMIVVVAVSWAVLKTDLFTTNSFMMSEPKTILGAYGEVAQRIFFTLLCVLAIFAAVDYALLRWEHQTKLRMTKQEAKEEFKEREGDPQIKARVRAMQRDMARKRMMQAVKKASVIITNPTHIAIAILYEKDSMFAPKVVAKGADHLAQRIKKIAEEAGIPMVENVPLARTLYRTVKIGHLVPRALYEAVAQVLAFVYRLKNKRSI